MPRRKSVPYASPYPSPDQSVLSGLTVEVSRETRRARTRAEYGSRVNTNANRRNGGGATSGTFRAEELAGRQIVSPQTATVKIKEDNGSTLPRQHMTATRKRHPLDGESPRNGKIRRRGRRQDAPTTRLQSEGEACREIERARIERRNLSEYQ